MIRFLVLLLATTIGLSCVVGRAEAQTVFEDRRPIDGGASIVKRIVYTGEGWRNLRRLSFERYIERANGERGLSITQAGYYFCGGRAYLNISQIENMRSDDVTEILGVQPDDELITVGALVDLDAEPGFVGRTQVSELLRGLSPICATAARSETIPDWLFMSSTEDSVTHLVPSRFTRQGATVRFWSETRYTRSAQVTMRSRNGSVRDTSWEVRLLSPDRGHQLDQEEANCGGNSLRSLQSITYDAHGEVSRMFTRPQTTASEVVPNSVGEAIVQIVCLIH